MTKQETENAKCLLRNLSGDLIKNIVYQNVEQGAGVLSVYLCVEAMLELVQAEDPLWQGSLLFDFWFIHFLTTLRHANLKYINQRNYRDDMVVASRQNILSVQT